MDGRFDCNKGNEAVSDKEGTFCLVTGHQWSLLYNSWSMGHALGYVLYTRV